MEALSSSEMLEQTSITQCENTTNDHNDTTVIKNVIVTIMHKELWGSELVSLHCAFMTQLDYNLSAAHTSFNTSPFPGHFHPNFFHSTKF